MRKAVSMSPLIKKFLHSFYICESKDIHAIYLVSLFLSIAIFKSVFYYVFCCCGRLFFAGENLFHEMKVKVNQTRCKFAESSLKICGHLLSRRDYHSLLSQLEIISNRL